MPHRLQCRGMWSATNQGRVPKPFPLSAAGGRSRAELPIPSGGKFSFEKLHMLHLEVLRLLHDLEQLSRMLGEWFLVFQGRYSRFLRSQLFGSSDDAHLCVWQHLFEHRASVHDCHLALHHSAATFAACSKLAAISSTRAMESWITFISRSNSCALASQFWASSRSPLSFAWLYNFLAKALRSSSARKATPRERRTFSSVITLIKSAV